MKGKFHDVLLASDFDDTLVDRRKRVPARTQTALRYFVSEGGAFTLASGRSMEAVRLQLPGLPVNAPVVAANGTQIFDCDREEMLFEARLPDCARQDFIEVMAAFPTLAVEVCAAGTLYCTRPNAVTAEHLRITGQTAVGRPLEELPEGWVYAKFEEAPEVLAQVQALFRSRYPGRYEAIFSAPYLLEVAPAGCGKGAGVLRVAELIGRTKIYCAGDSENDLSMLTIGTGSFAPANGSPAAKAAAGVVVCDCDEGAIADVVEWLDQRYD